MSEQKDAVSLTVPERCRRGHELTPRTTHVVTMRKGRIDLATTEPVGWNCVRCLREDLWTAHYSRHSDPAQRGRPIPAELLAETAFERQKNAQLDKTGPSAWTERVHFESGRQYADPGSVPDPERVTRQARRRTRNQAKRDRGAA
ncbi:hypothetical protein ACFWAY_23815 [Rhodococcus sp. NPDC059968]|uniref:hypothetical protein n=1 Tax=Rhodococcus sp. NPDC059968 TaxID=3347017 RepID=UPI0036705307